eukprot:scaffold1525_cov142-Cylindrotheca_fusiformis.AAC.103
MAVYSYQLPRNTMESPFRQLTFIGDDDVYKPDPEKNFLGHIVGFAAIGLISIALALVAIKLSRQTRELYEWNAIRLVIPGVLLFLGLECGTMAFFYGHCSISRQWTIAIYMLESTLAPGIFTSTFATTFLAYRTRSIPFCMVYRGPGRSHTNPTPGEEDDDEETQALIRPATMVVLMRVFTLGILVLNFGVNFDVIWDESDLAGKTGWITVIQDSSEQESDHVVASLLPIGLTSLSCIYFSFLLWRYGSEFSMVVYPSSINPWIYTLVGSLIMIAGQFPGPNLFPILSNVGILVYMMTLLRVLFEVRHDMMQAGDLGQFLHAVGQDHIAKSMSDVSNNLPKGDIETAGMSSSTEDGEGLYKKNVPNIS